MGASTPLWGNFVGYADWDLLSFAWLYVGGLRVASYYHATQAAEKYLKALTLSILDPGGKTETAINNRWLHTHDLVELASYCATHFPYYGQPETISRLKRFTEFDQVSRYPWTAQEHGNGFDSSDVPWLWDLIRHLRNDLPIQVDDYILGMLVRGYHYGKPEVNANAFMMADLRQCVSALRHLFPDVDSVVRR